MTICHFDLRLIARALGGDVCGRQVLAPAPGHSPSDRSMSIRLAPDAPDGFLAFGHAGDDWRNCRDYVRSKLGIGWERPLKFEGTPHSAQPRAAVKDEGPDPRIAGAMALWNEGTDPRGTVVEKYLASRSLHLDDELAGDVLRWHAGINAMLSLFRGIRSGEPQALARTFLNAEGRKLERKFLGPVGGAAIMLDGFHDVTSGLHVSEGAESGIAARMLGLKPTWALGSAGAVASFPVLPGIECLTLLAENDDASARAVEQCAARWHAAGREILINRSRIGKDLADAFRGDAA